MIKIKTISALSHFNYNFSAIGIASYAVYHTAEQNLNVLNRFIVSMVAGFEVHA